MSVLVFLHALSLPFAWLLKKLMGTRYRNLLLPGLFAVNLSGRPASLPGNVFIFLFTLLFSLLMAGYIHGRRLYKKAT